jgi:anti-anti-sigma factor
MTANAMEGHGIHVDTGPACAPYMARVSLSGEHDLATSPGIAAVLEPLYGTVLLDLSDCSFIDSSVVSVTVSKALELKREGARLDLVVTKGTQVDQTLALAGMREILNVRVVERAVELPGSQVVGHARPASGVSRLDSSR